MRFIVAVLALVFAALASPAHAEFRWKNPGADPYATSREEAMKTRGNAFHKLGFPQPVVELLVEATKAPGKKEKLVMGSRLTAMLSKGGVVHKDVIVDWKAPIRGTELVAPVETWQITHEGRTYTATLFDVCNNWSGIVASAPVASAPPASAQPPAVPPVFVTGTCPNGYTLIANAWSLGSLGGLREEAEKLIKAANERESQEATLLAAYKPDALSRTLGGRLRSEVKVRAPIAVDVRVRYLDPQTAKPVRELGVIHLARGVGNFRFPDDPRSYVVETIWPADFVSPAMSGGERRLRMFGDEWGKFCAMNKHGAVLP